MEKNKMLYPAWRAFKDNFLLLPAGLCFLYFFMSISYNSIYVAQIWIWLVAGGFFLCLYLWKRFQPETLAAHKWYRVIRITLRSVFLAFTAFFLVMECFIVANLFPSEDGDLDYIIILGAK
ncbi:MAG: hypothetical protein PHW77_07980, partial [Eubacteriales bacterium]|nr:hypothetical protein [Eubacteriales bacterium]